MCKCPTLPQSTSREDRHSIDSDHGISGLSVFRKIADNLIYQEKYPLIDQGMSYSNIGAPKKKNIKNHLFIIYGIINSVLKGEKACVDIQICDLVKACDVLWLQDTTNDVWDTLQQYRCTERSTRPRNRHVLRRNEDKIPVEFQKTSKNKV